ncbi:MAG: glycoside hydrolase family 2 protein [candidate division KSB1 bacterium]|jgi:beta-mannosidase|nr:glycoside hydrolase family 2 protein [candidate division KSB1 bacterium]
MQNIRSQSLNEGWTFHQIGKTEYYPARVPGCVHLDLLDNGLIDDPFYRENEKLMQWIEKMYWEYSLEFDPDADIFERKNIELIFDGIDTYATVLLNDEQVIQADNMFRPWRADVRDLIKEKKNQLLVRFRSAVMEILPRIQQLDYRLPVPFDKQFGTMPYTRKAAYHYEWDWGPRLVTSGLWRPVRLVAWDQIMIRDMSLKVLSLNSKKAKLQLTLEVMAEQKCKAKMKICDDRGRAKENTKVGLEEGESTIQYDFVISDPERWWPRGYGEQPMYDIQVELSAKGETAAASRRIGLRTVALDAEEDDAGRKFSFSVNGVPVYAKGANWIPADNFTPRVSAERYRHLISSASDANMNMLRVWGGGIYEDDIFYELCDEYGILVWQDFMFACALYPGDDTFLDSVREEATYQVRRLRHHPCLVLWCGNNEIGQGWNEWNWKKELPEDVWSDYGRLFHGVLKDVCAREDDSRTYWPTSPGNDFEQMKEAQDHSRGDTHYWGVWHGKEPFDKYTEISPRFMSEYGFQSFPEPNAVNRFAIEEDKELFSPVMLNHQRCPNGNSLIKTYMEKYYTVPVTFDKFVLMSQILQAEGIKAGTEHFRRIRPHCMGSLYWQLNDCWPAASWASIDYYGNWKALHYAAKRFYSTFLVSPVLKGSSIDIHIVSDDTNAVKAGLIVRLYSMDGPLLSEWKRKIRIKPLSSDIPLTLEMDDFPEEARPEESFLYCALETEDGLLAENMLLCVSPKEVRLPEPRYSIAYEQVESGIALNLTSENLVRHLFLSAPDIPGTFDDNFFDLYPGITRKVLFQPEDKDLSLSKIESKVTMLSLHDLLK